MPRYEEEEWVVENTWTCSSCGSDNRGRDLRCAKCSSPKDADEAASEKIDPDNRATEKEVLDLAISGADWVCEFCKGKERNTNGECAYCGAQRVLSEPVPVGKTAPRGHTKRDPEEEARWHAEWEAQKHAEAEVLLDARTPIMGTVLVVGGVGALIVGAISLIVYLVVPHDETVTVSSVAWEYTSVLFEKTLRHGEGWDDGMPGGSFAPGAEGEAPVCEVRQKGTTRCNPYDCNPHKVEFECRPSKCNPYKVDVKCNPHDCRCTTERVCRNNGNGTSTCKKVKDCDTCYDTCSKTKYRTCHETCDRTEYDTCWKTCPVMDGWCRYDYYEWPEIARRTNRGTSDDVTWPDLIATDSSRRLDRTERYEVGFTDGENKWTYNPRSLTEFKAFNLSEGWTIEVNRFGVVNPKTKAGNIPTEKVP